MKSRISNLNSFSAIIDRLIVENLKLLTFIDRNDDKAESQKIIISEIRKELDDVFQEITNGSYSSVGENRTYESTSTELIDDIFKLCTSNYVIGKLDAEKIKLNVDGDLLKGYVLQVRDYLEFRAHIKNKIEDNVKQI